MSFVHISAVLEAAPPTPACFAHRTAWSEYLFSAQKSKIAVRPFDDRGVYQPYFSFCRDCTQAHTEQMTLAGKCDPRKFFSNLIAKELA